MSAITIDHNLAHYEVLGRGRPVILLHGWLGSWRYWVPAMQQLSMKYRTYALDLWGFGDSARDVSRYDFESQVTLLYEFMEKLGINKAALVGHGLGAAVIVRYATLHPDRVPRLMAISPPLFRRESSEAPPNIPPLPAASSTDPVHTEAETVPWRTEEMKARIQADMEKHAQILGEELTLNLHPGSDQDTLTLAADHPTAETPSSSTDQNTNLLKDRLGKLDRIALLKQHVAPGPDLEKLLTEVKKADNMALTMSVDSFSTVDILRELHTLTMACVTVYGEHDTFLPGPDTAMLSSLKNNQQFHAIKMPSIKHFPMLENIAGFTRLLLDFLEVSDVKQLTIKETWERRVR